MLKKQNYSLKITFIEPILGTQPQKEVATEYITSKAADPNTGELPADELETLPESLAKATTAFHKKDGAPILYDYQVRGFLKEAGGTFNGLYGVKNLRSKINNYVFVFPRQIVLNLPKEAEIAFLERPLRGMTAQGPRVSLARSEMLPKGTFFWCNLEVYSEAITEKLLRDILEYGGLQGIGQWRNGSYGRFTFELTKLADTTDGE